MTGLPPLLEKKPWSAEIPASRAAAAIMVGFLLQPLIAITAGIFLPTVFFLAAALLLIKDGGALREKLGFRWPERGALLLLAKALLVLYAANFVLVGLWQRLLDAFHVDYSPSQGIFELLGAGSGPGFWLLIFEVVIVVPAVEELVFRRLLFGLFLPFGAVHAFFLTAILFSAVHFFLLGAPALLLMGLIFQFVYLATGSLAMPMLLHGAVNLIAVLPFLF